MKCQPREKGQVLVLVALALTVLLLASALAVDLGLAYAERRQLQNAADAGALAGARVLCAGSGGNPVSEATTYVEANFPEGERPEITAAIWNMAGGVDPTGNVVYVRAAKRVDTFFARVIGVESVTVAAEAAAACGEAESGCGIFPIAFNYDVWKDIPCYAAGATTKTYFYVWDDDTVDGNLCTKCNCGAVDRNFQAGVHIGPGERGWVRLDTPASPYDELVDPSCKNTNNCGTDALTCWLQFDYPGLVSWGEGGAGSCVPGEPGVINTALDTVKEHRVGDVVSIILWDRECTAVEGAQNKVGTCPGTLYHIRDAGCVYVDYVYAGSEKLTLDPLPGHKQQECPKNAKAIRVYKRCDCDVTSCGSTSGAPGGAGDIEAVSLISIPGR